MREFAFFFSFIYNIELFYIEKSKGAVYNNIKGCVQS